jgi:recombinational DNA repair protein RecT
VLYRSPRVLFVDADLIYEADHFEYEKGAVPRLVHKPNVFGDRGKRLGAYALVQLDTGFLRPIVLNEDAITSRRKRARDPEKGTWAEWPDEMARKTALRALMSLVPIERGVRAALATEDRKYPALASVAAVPELAAGPAPETRPVPAIEAARAAFLPEPEPAEAPSEEPEEPEEIFGEAVEVAEEAAPAVVPEPWTRDRLHAAATKAGVVKQTAEVFGQVAEGRKAADLTEADWKEMAKRLGLEP